MEKDKRLELIDLAIQNHIQDNTDNNNNHKLKDHETEYQLALSQLLFVSQELEMSKRDKTVNKSVASSPSEPVASVNEKKEGKIVDDEGCKVNVNDEIIKELKKVKKQNFVTHCLLSVMIVLTVTWQLSQVSLILKVKNGIKHPFRSFGKMVKDMVKDKVPAINGQEADDKENDESTSLPSLKIPDMTQIDVPNLGKE